MNYWCALWFWEYKDADKIPTREEYWSDIENILNIDFSTKTFSEAKFSLTSPDLSIEQPSLFDPIGEPEPLPEGDAEVVPEEEQREMVEDFINNYDEAKFTKEDAQKILDSITSSGSLFENARTPIVKELANRYHFFHPQLEFIEVFWLRDGFDIICGNPPWVNIDFDEQGIISEKFPEVSIRNNSAPEIRVMKAEFLKDTHLERSYYSEKNLTYCESAFVGSFVNYPLITGQRANLYKCILENNLFIVAKNGYVGLLHPESIFVDPKGQPLRQELYRRIIYHFQYQNELKLFAEVDHHTSFGESIYRGLESDVDFYSIHNLFHPSTIDGCFSHDGHGTCPGLKDGGQWSISAHKNRIVHFTTKELKVLSNTFEPGGDWASVKLVSVHANYIIDVLDCLSKFPTTIKDFPHFITQGFNETIEIDKKRISKRTCYPNYDSYEMIYCGPNLFVSNPLYKNPRQVCKVNLDYDTVLFNNKTDSLITRTNYVPNIPLIQFKEYINDTGNNPILWIDRYKLGFRKMIPLTTERSLIGAVIPPKASHIGGIISITFDDNSKLIEACGLTSSIILDFYIKTIGATNLYEDRMNSLPLGIDNKYKRSLCLRTLLLNSLNTFYKELWECLWDDSYFDESWSISDQRLKPFNTLSEVWNNNIPLRSFYERRQALLEIDVITSMALGLSLNDLIMVYRIQFPVLQQNENDTWYDQRGNIVFTCSAGLKGVGVDRPVWETIRNQKEGETYTHTIDPAKSELYGGQQVTYYAPYTKCDRIEDYRRAWAHFEKIFNEK